LRSGILVDGLFDARLSHFLYLSDS
jgi:hypothetical protein